MDVNIDQVTVTCDECGNFLKLEVDVSLFDVRHLSTLIKAAGWGASANCGHILCSECKSSYWDTDDE